MSTKRLPHKNGILKQAKAIFDTHTYVKKICEYEKIAHELKTINA